MDGVILLGMLFGLAVGSFINVVISRYPSKTITGRSHCIHCGRTLRWFELVPLVSFFVLRRRCRTCRGTISWRYPIVELSAAVAFPAVSILSSDPLMLVWLWGVAGLAVFIAAYDAAHMEIPDGATLALFVWVAGGTLLFLHDTIHIRLFAALGFSGFFLLLYAISGGRWLGGGDVKLAFVLGWLLGWPGSAVAFVLAYGIGAVVALALMAARSVTLRSHIPFAPFLIAAALIALVWSEAIMHWFTTLIIT